MIYYLFSYNTNLPGVNIKVKEKIISLRNAGVDIKGLILYSDKDLNLDHLPDEMFEKHYYVPKKHNYRLLRTRWLGFFNSAVQNYVAVKELYDLFLADKKFQYVILRYGTSDYSTSWFLKKMKGRVIFESNTNEVEQLKLRFKGIFQTPAWISYDYLSEKYFAPGILAKAAAMVCVTNEISVYQRERIGDKKAPKISTISNGINVESFPMAPMVKLDGKAVNLIMMCGGDVTWNGIDKIAPYAAEGNFKLFVVGDVTQEFKSENIVYTGKLNTDQITELIIKEEICAGVGSLAVERKGLSEAAPLKVREYLARGLPVIYSYNDTDIDGDVLFRDAFCVKLPLGIQKLDPVMICEKLRRITKVPDYNKKVKEFAMKNVDMVSKAKQYKQMINSLDIN